MSTLSLLETLVAFPTVSRDSNLELIEFARDHLIASGADVSVIKDSTGRKANLFAHLGPLGQGGILLSGHTDVVPVDGQEWTSNPFRLTQRGDRLFGRGTADMKGFIACALHAAQLAHQGHLRQPLQFSLSHDEEIGCVGVRSLIRAMEDWPHLPVACIIGEPTQMRTALGHKGKTALTAFCHGRPAHSASPGHGVNAIYMASELIGRVRRLQADLIEHGAKDPSYEVPSTTLHVGVIHGGTALNVVPATCEIEIEVRNIGADDPDRLITSLRETGDAIAYDFDALEREARIDLVVTNAYPGMDTSSQAEIVTLMAQLTGDREPVKVSFGSEGGLFSRELRIPTVICGPGSIDQAHRPDEYVTLDQLKRCDLMLERLVKHVA
jgi:acetylornithine deacetylase